jgi:BirA family transcriptional regulator, biotin operon repressor / biotin---[acetyl-CoA-carboxylase] ligase
LASVAFVRRIVVLESTGSTNDDVRRLAAGGAPEGTIVLAERQISGRGRMGRVWESPAGLGLYMSVLFRPNDPADRLGRYAIAAAVAVGDACRELANAPVILKWPNDVLANGKKLAGILAELRHGPGGAELVLGIGVNVHQREQDLSPDVAGLATSLRALRGETSVDRETVAVAVLSALAGSAALLRAGAWPELVERFLAHAPGARGRRARTAAGSVGVTNGLHASGALMIETADGTVLAHASESVTLIEE